MKSSKKKKCPDCKKVKSSSEYGRNKSRVDGLQGYCLVCMRVRSLASYDKHRDSYFLRAKKRDKELDALVYKAKDIPCADCGRKYPHYVMDFDHVGSERKFLNICRMRARRFAFDKILSEIAKCEVVCSNCHRIRTNKRNPSRYSKYNNF